MEVLFQVPDDIVEKLETRWANLSRGAMEGLAVQGYRAGVLTSAEVQRMLGLSSRWDTDEFLKRAGAFLDYTESDLQSDVETIRGLLAR